MAQLQFFDRIHIAFNLSQLYVLAGSIACIAAMSEGTSGALGLQLQRMQSAQDASSAWLNLEREGRVSRDLVDFALLLFLFALATPHSETEIDRERDLGVLLFLCVVVVGVVCRH